MNRFLKLLTPLAFLAILAGLLFLVDGGYKAYADQHANTNISYSTGQFWAWNDVIGWIDFHTTHTVLVTGSAVKGYASSTTGEFSFDCATSPTGNICGTSDYHVFNDGSGNLSGWGWNNTYGWVSFCGGAGTANCPGGVAYQVQVNMSTGVFRGDGDDYAWNDLLGWISFNCANHSGCGISDYKVVVGNASTTVGYLDSTPYDTGVTGGAQINSAIWRGTLPAGANVYFQFATSNDSGGPWSFVGPDGTGNTYYGPTSPNTSYKVDYSLHNNKRYFKYRVYLYSDSFLFSSPRVDEVLVNWSP